MNIPRQSASIVVLSAIIGMNQGTASAQPDIPGLEAIVLAGPNGDPARPVPEGMQYGVFSYVAPGFININGTVVFYAEVTPTGGGSPLRGIWVSQLAGALLRVAEEGRVAPVDGSGTWTFTAVSDFPAINDDGLVCFRGKADRQGTPSATAEGIWSWSATAGLTLLVRDGVSAGGAPGTLTNIFRTSRSADISEVIQPKVLLNASGDLLFHAGRTGGGVDAGKGVWRRVGTTIEGLIWDKLSAPDYHTTPVPALSQVKYHDFNADGVSIVTADGAPRSGMTSTLETLLYFGEPGDLELIGGQLGEVQRLPSLDSSEPLFGNLTSSTPENFVRGSTSLQVVFDLDTDVPCVSGATFLPQLGETGFVNNNNICMFFGNYDPPSGGSGLFFKDLTTSALSCILTTGSLDSQRTVTGFEPSMASFSLNNSEQTIFAATVQDLTAGETAELFVTNPSPSCLKSVLVADGEYGTLFDVYRDDQFIARVVSIQLGSADGIGGLEPLAPTEAILTRDHLGNGYAVLNDRCRAVVALGLHKQLSGGGTDAYTGLFRYIIPKSPDLNRDGVVDFLDYLEYLNRFDVLDPSVDFSCDGVVDFVDTLEFYVLFDETRVCGWE